MAVFARERGNPGDAQIFAHRRLRAPYRWRGLCAFPLAALTSSLPCDDRACGVLLRRGLDCRCLGAALHITLAPQVVTASPSIAVPAPATSAAGQPLNPQNTFSAGVTPIR